MKLFGLLAAILFVSVGSAFAKDTMVVSPPKDAERDAISALKYPSDASSKLGVSILVEDCTLLMSTSRSDTFTNMNLVTMVYEGENLAETLKYREKPESAKFFDQCSATARGILSKRDKKSRSNKSP